MKKINRIHSTAIIEKGAKISKGAEIGPYTVVGKNVTLGKGTKIGPFCVLDGWTTIGDNCQISSSCVIGAPPQDLRYKLERSFVYIGDDNIIREFVTIHRGAQKDEETIIGNQNMLMAYVHVAHNCILGDEIVIANSTGLSGYIHIEDQAVIGGMVGIHQFVRIGRLAMIGGYSKITKDVPPFTLVDGHPAKLYGINSRGLIRRGILPKPRLAIKTAFKIITNPKLNLSQAINQIEKKIAPHKEIKQLLNFLKNPSRKGILIKDTTKRNNHLNNNEI